MAYASAALICARLKGRWTRGHHGTCLCPAHDDSTPSLSVSETRDGRVLVHCFSGCDQTSVITALRNLGLWGDGPAVIDPSYPGGATSHYDGINSKTDRARRQGAQDIWDKGRAAQGTLAEAYLRARGIRLPMSDQLRYVASLKHTEANKSYPAMLARISDESGFCAVQRTYLDPKEPRKADASPAKKTKGPMGGGAVRLRAPSLGVLGLAEGIETALSVSALYAIPCWATLSAHRLGKIEIPNMVKSIVIFGDSGDVGREKAFEACEIYERRGLFVDVVFPAAHFDGAPDDFNTALQASP